MSEYVPSLFKSFQWLLNHVQNKSKVITIVYKELYDLHLFLVFSLISGALIILTSLLFLENIPVTATVRFCSCCSFCLKSLCTPKYLHDLFLYNIQFLHCLRKAFPNRFKQYPVLLVFIASIMACHYIVEMLLIYLQTHSVKLRT